jgi:hypothetical protein
MRPFSSVGGRLALALLLVVAGVLAIVYVIVVPSYKTSLENNELNALQKQLLSRAVPTFPTAPFLKQQYAQTLAPRVNARVVVFDLQNETPALLVPYADSNVEGDSSDVVNDPVAFDAIRLQTLARGTVTRKGQESAEVAYPIGASVVMMPAALFWRVELFWVSRLCFLTRFTPWTVTRPALGSTAMTSPVAPLSLPAMTLTRSPFFTCSEFAIVTTPPGPAR